MYRDIQPRTGGARRFLVARCTATFPWRVNLPLRMRNEIVVESVKPRRKLPRIPVELHAHPPIAIDSTRGLSDAMADGEVPRSLGFQLIEWHVGVHLYADGCLNVRWQEMKSFKSARALLHQPLVRRPKATLWAVYAMFAMCQVRDHAVQRFLSNWIPPNRVSAG